MYRVGSLGERMFSTMRLVKALRSLSLVWGWAEMRAIHTATLWTTCLGVLPLAADGWEEEEEEERDACCWWLGKFRAMSFLVVGVGGWVGGRRRWVGGWVGLTSREEMREV